MHHRTMLFFILAATLIAACSERSTVNDHHDLSATTAATADTGDTVDTSVVADNPLLTEWSTRFGAVPFDRIEIEHLPAALDHAMAAQKQAVKDLLANDEPPDVANTFEVLERSGAALRRAGAVFGVYVASLSDERVRAIQSDYAPRLARHQTDLLLDPRLFARVEQVYERIDELAADDEARRLVERTRERFLRAGAALEPAVRERVAALTQRQAELQTRFNQNLLRDTDAFLLVLDEDELDGLPEGVRDGAAQTAAARGHTGRHAFTLQRPDVEAFLTWSTRRDLRERLFKAFIARGDNGNEFDNNAIIAELVALRAELARHLGHPSYAHLVAADAMARTPEAVGDLLDRVWQPALNQAKAEREVLRARIAEAGEEHPLEGWDWRHYAEQVRAAEYDLDPAELNPYLSLDNMLAAAFHVTARLFDLHFIELDDVPVYHPDVRVFEVRNAEGAHAGLFYADFFAREGKQGGAWMASLRPQHRLDGPVTAHVTNTLNVAKPSPGRPALISMTEATTLFHELGHALHGLLSDVRYPSLSGTNVPRDYVEFPAQFMEHYVTQPQVLEQFARHVDTGEPMPEALMQRFIAASRFNQGFATVEFLASALVDQRYHALTPDQAQGLDPVAFEREAMREIGALEQIPMRHRSPHFAHIFGGGYSAAYYSYMWSEVLDADGFEAFEETGDIFDPATAERLLRHVYSRGDSRDWMQAYVDFRGREPSVEALLRNRGLAVRD